MEKNLDDFYELNPYAEEALFNKIERYHASFDRESIEGSSGSLPKFSEKRKYSSNSVIMKRIVLQPIHM